MYIDKSKLPKKSNKVYSPEQLSVERFFSYEATFKIIRDVAYSSVYSTICPPIFENMGYDTLKHLQWYGNYLITLQNEYKELIEFCFDDNFYPSVLGHLYPSERYYLYRHIHNLPHSSSRKEIFETSMLSDGGNTMPYGMSEEGSMERIKREMNKPSQEHIEFAEKYNIPQHRIMHATNRPSYISIHYEVHTIAEMLELEFTKMLEQNIRFRKCKRCGKYFVMKGNYDTNYCDRIAEGETRNCQELAAIENYKAKIADNKAIPIYNKYYKRYAARVKVNQIKEPDFKKWKYQAMTKRDECAEGIISVEEYIEWMEAAFPNRKPKTESKS